MTLQRAEAWLDVKSASRLTGYNPEYLRHLVRQGEIEAAKGKKATYKLKLSSLLAYLEAKKR